MANPDADDATIALKQRERWGFVQHLDALSRAARMQGFHQLLAAAPDMAGEPAPELELAADIERLAAEAELKPHALFAHPAPRLEALGDEDLGEVGVRAPFGQAADIVVILLGCVSADIDTRKLVLAQVRDELSEVVEAMIDEAECAAGEGRVAAGRFLGRDLQHQHRDAVLARAQGRAGRRVSGADNDDVALGDVHFLPPNVSHPGAVPGSSREKAIVAQHPTLSVLLRR